MPNASRAERELAAAAVAEYDAAIVALVSGRTPRVAGVDILPTDPVTLPVIVAQRGAAIHSVINALNVALVAQSEPTMCVRRAVVVRVRFAVAEARSGRDERMRVCVS